MDGSSPADVTQTADKPAVDMELHAQVEAGVKSSIIATLGKMHTIMDAKIAMAHERFHAGIEYFLQADKNIIITFTKELSIFHRLEAHLRSGTITESVCKETLDDLTEHRADVAKQNASQSNEAAATAQPAQAQTPTPSVSVDTQGANGSTT